MHLFNLSQLNNYRDNKKINISRIRKTSKPTMKIPCICLLFLETQKAMEVVVCQYIGNITAKVLMTKKIPCHITNLCLYREHMRLTKAKSR